MDIFVTMSQRRAQICVSTADIVQILVISWFSLLFFPLNLLKMKYCHIQVVVIWYFARAVTSVTAHELRRQFIKEKKHIAMISI